MAYQREYLAHMRSVVNMKHVDLDAIEFAVLSEDEIRSISVMEVVETEIYDEKGVVPGGLRDEMMGPTSIGADENKCKICGHYTQKCGGHFARIEFPLYLFHIHRVNEVIKVLKSTCCKCGADVTRAKKKICPECKTKQPTITWNSKRCLISVDKKDTLADKLVDWLGDAKTLLMKNMLVPPNQLRPPPTVGNEEIMGEEPTTRGLLQIMRTLKSLKNKIKSGDPQNMIDQSAENLQKHVNIYIDRQKTTKTRGGQSLADRLRGKRGRLRGNTQGKRCNFTARSVVTGDAMLGMREVGVPRSIADNVTKRVTVSTLNRPFLLDLLHKKKIKTVYRGDQMYDLANKSSTTVLYVGDEVDRSLLDGDYVLFNRQPSLHRPSIQAHRVRILPWSTFRLNLSCTTPYNADFDGDEMNMHSCQSVEAEAEMASIVAVNHNFITPSSHRPIMSIVQDTLLALYEISHPDYYMDYEAVWQWHFAAGIEGDPPKERRRYKGTEVLSMSFPDDLNYKRGDFEIKDGQIVSGRINKKIMGRSDGSLVHNIVLDYGGEKMCDIIDTFQRGVSNWSYTMGFSIGISDMVPKRETTRRIQQACDEAYASILPDDTEDQINSKLNSARDSMGKLAIHSTTEDNCLRRIVESGTKGSLVNIMQVTAAVGQQNCKGVRMQPCISGRTLPCFTADDNGGRARGFVRSPYITGLTPDEFFFHAVGGREGLCDTAIKTSQTGYIQRRLCKAMESLVVQYDLSVRDNKNNIVQFLYGEDGFDPTKVEMDGGKHPVQIPVKRILSQHADSNRKRRRKRHKEPAFGIPKLDEYITKQCEQAPPMSAKAFGRACDEIEKRFHRNQVEPGESVGVVAAQSIGEPVTQMTLNTFHSAGNSASNVTLGVPRFEELINASNSAKIKRNFFKTETKNEAFSKMNEIRETKVKHLITNRFIEPYTLKSEHAEYRMFPDEPLYEDRFNSWMVWVKISRKALTQRNIRLETVVDSAKTFSKKKVEVHWNHPKKTDPVLAIYFKNTDLRKIDIRNWLNSWEDYIIHGIRGIKNAFMTKNGFETEGSNLRDTLLFDKNVLSDDIWDVIDVLGVEAAREVLFREIKRVLKANGAYVSSRHLMLLCDWMTQQGGIRGTTRHGNSGSVFARASYEQPVVVLQEAAMEEKTDPLNGVSEQLIFGKRPKVGSELCSMVTSVVVEKKTRAKQWNGNFQFRQKLKRKREPQKHEQVPMPAPVFRPQPPIHSNISPWAVKQTPKRAPESPQAPAPWMMAQSW